MNRTEGTQTVAAGTLRASARLERDHARELQRGERFGFGANWTRFLAVLTDDRIAEAEASLRAMLGVDDLHGRSFLDVGSGSGLFSLAARRLGARVRSFDYDPASVSCALELRRRYFPDDPEWRVELGSVLDESWMAALGEFDIVYAWGVLHHTGHMWRALANVAGAVAPGGRIFLAIYNDQGNWSARWRRVKRLYCSGRTGKALVCATFIPSFALRNLFSDLIALRNPAKRYTEYKRNRGMSAVHDWLDWLGGFPFEVAKPEEIFDFYASRGFRLQRLRTCGGSLGCNEFIFERPSEGARSSLGRDVLAASAPAAQAR